MKKISVLLMALLGATALVACNSGGGSSPSNNGGDPTPAPTPTPNTNGKWVQVGAPFANQVFAALPIFYDKATNSVYLLNNLLYGTTQLCSIGADASSTTPWSCTTVTGLTDISVSKVTSDSDGNLYVFGVDNNTPLPHPNFIYTINMASRAVTKASKIYENYFDGSNYVEKPIEPRSSVGGFNYYGGKLYWFATPYNIYSESAMSVSPDGGAVTISAVSRGFKSSDVSEIDISGKRYSYYSISGSFVKSSLLGTDLQDWVSSTSLLSDFTIQGDYLYTCGRDLSNPVQQIRLDATSATPWTSLSHDGIAGVCMSITHGNGYLFANAQVAQDGFLTPPFTLVKYKH